MSSGDEIEAGRITTAESTTDLVGALPSERDVDFNGDVILRVGPEPGRLSPYGPLMVFMGSLRSLLTDGSEAWWRRSGRIWWWEPRYWGKGAGGCGQRER